jgi:sugar phosphate isomerase/epimerase
VRKGARRVEIGVQLIVWGDRARRERRAVLAEVAACGYAGVEMAPPEDVDAALEDLRALGLRVAASHIHTGVLERDLDRHLAWLERTGARLLACSGGDYPTSAQYREVARRLDVAGARCREHGITFCYHNHAHEIHHDLFGLGHILRATDPANVKLNLDTYWIARGGQDPAAIIRLLGDRVAYLHLKDMAPDGSFAEVGSGQLDWAAIRDVAASLQLPWCVVEQDRTQRTPLESSRMSREFLRRHWGI